MWRGRAGCLFEALLDLMSRALEGLNGLPWGVHLMVTLFMAVGLLLWLTGERMLKPLVVAAASVIGGLIGALVVPSTSWGASMTIWHGVGLGLAGGLVVGLLLFRSAMAVGFGVVLGALLPLIAATALQVYSTNDGDQPAASRPSTDSSTILAHFQAKKDSEAPVDLEKVPENLRPAAERIGAFWTTFTSEVSDRWNRMPGAHHAIILMAAAIGLAAGVIGGLSMPRWAGGAVASMFGAGLWLPSFVWLSNALGAPWKQALDRSPAQWLVIWAGIALLGMIAQWSGLTGGKKKKSAPKQVAAPAAAA